ncbi:VanZ family protein [Streptomyces sp. NPDC101776]|uniref:VanZ family protein n=1 Tax=Streptomyces sp. NPDC101776 TaxID=3366146 RepID=UPI0037FA29EA
MWRVVFYVTPATCLAAIAATVLACLAVERLYSRHPDSVRSAARVFLSLWSFLVLAVTVIPEGTLGTDDGKIYWLPGEGLLYGTSGLDASEISMIFKQEAANALMFIPLCVLAYYSARRPSLYIALGSCVAFSFVIEFTQWLERAGRTADVDDLTFNTLGAVIGALAIGFASFAVARSGAPARGPAHSARR